MKNRIWMGTALLMLIMILASCGGPEEKKLKFYKKGQALYEKGDYVRARLEFRNAIQIDKKYADAYYMLGMIALKSGDARGAYGSFAKVVDLSPHYWDAHVQLGKFLLAAGLADESMKKAKLVLASEPKNEDALILEGAVLLKKKDMDGAQRFLESVVGHDVRKPDGYLLLTSIYAQKGNKQGIEKTLRDGIRANGKAVSLSIALADFYLKNKQTDEALEIMKKVVETEPQVGQHRLALAGIYWGLGREKEAADELKAIVSMNPKKAEWWVSAADFYGARNRIGDAEQMLKQGISQNEKSFQLRFALSSLYLATGRPDQAVSLLKECLTLEKDQANPNILQTKNSLAQFYLARQDIGKAQQYADEVIKASPKNVDANYIQGTIHLKKHEGLQAVSSFRTVINERPEFIPGHIGLAEAHAINKEYSLAFDTLRNALKNAPRSRRNILRATARIYAIQKDFKKAEIQYREILDSYPKDLEVRADLGDLMIQSGDIRRAEAEYAAIKKQSPDHPLGYIKLSALYMAQKKWDRAIAELEHITGIHPNLWSATNDLAILLSEYGKGKKDLDRALVLAEKARTLHPEDPNIFDTLGWIDYRRGDLPQALVWLAKAQEKYPKNPVFNYHLGMAHYRAGNTAKAKTYLRIALASKVSFPGKEDAEKVISGIR